MFFITKQIYENVFYDFSEGDEQREVDQAKAHVLKMFEHIGEQTNNNIKTNKKYKN